MVLKLAHHEKPKVQGLPLAYQTNCVYHASIIGQCTFSSFTTRVYVATTTSGATSIRQRTMNLTGLHTLKMMTDTCGRARIQAYMSTRSPPQTCTRERGQAHTHTRTTISPIHISTPFHHASKRTQIDPQTKEEILINGGSNVRSQWTDDSIEGIRKDDDFSSITWQSGEGDDCNYDTEYKELQTDYCEWTLGANMSAPSTTCSSSLIHNTQHTTHPAVTEGSDDGDDDDGYYFYYYYNYWNNGDDDSGSITQRSLTKCQAVCDETDDCWAITWDPTDSWCDICTGMSVLWGNNASADGEYVDVCAKMLKSLHDACV